MKIGELARRSDCSIETIRFYEKQQLLPAIPRTSGNYRNYDESHLERLCFIRNCRSLDMTHSEIRELLHLMDSDQDNCEQVNHVLDEHISHVSNRLTELTGLLEQLKQLRLSCDFNQGLSTQTRHCRIVDSLTHMNKPDKPVSGI